MIENIPVALKSSLVTLPSYFLPMLRKATKDLLSVTIFVCLPLQSMSYLEIIFNFQNLCEFFRYLSVISFKFNSIGVREHILYNFSSFRCVEFWFMA